MKVSNMFRHAIIFLICVFSTISQANNPTLVPWPVGTTAGQMNFTKTLMNSYGDPNGPWSAGMFHSGVDFDSHTESPVCSDVRCVIDNAVISHWFWTPFEPDTLPREWVVVTTSGTGEFNHEDYGWAYMHLFDPRAEPFNWDIWDPIDEGNHIQWMNIHTPTIHTHFNWTDWNIANICYVNPLDYLTPAPTGSNYTWTFNPEGYTNAFEYFFLEDMEHSAWPESSGDVINIMMDKYLLYGEVDVFFGFGLSGVGQSTTPECGRNDLAPERIKWNIQREKVTGLEPLLEKYLVNFNCALDPDTNVKVMQLYFRHDLDDMYDYGPGAGEHEGLIFCLTNCGDMQDFDNLGIDNIEENCWQTNSNHLYSGETVNPVLAAFPDGVYQLYVTCYAHDETVTFPESSENLSCELHNFSPALRKVSILDATSSQVYYFAEWIPNDLSADLLITVNEQVDAGAELQVILWFTESMTTSSMSASLGPLSVGNGEWSSSVVPNDTWAGEVTMPTDTGKGEYILFCERN